MDWLRAGFDREQALGDLIARVGYKDGWSFELTSSALLIRVRTVDSLGGRPIEIVHMLPLMAVPMDERQLRRWLFEQITLVERHEAMEFFKVDGVAPYFPDHRPGGDPYALVDRDAPKSEDLWGMTIGSGQVNDLGFGRGRDGGRN